MTRGFHELEARVLERLAGVETAIEVPELARRLGIDQSPVAGALTVLAEQGLAELDERSEDEHRLGPKGSAWAESGFPERRVARALVQLGGRASLRDLPERSGLDRREIGESLKWLTQRGWAVKQGADLSLTATFADPEPELAADEQVVCWLAEHGPASHARLLEAGQPIERARALLSKRADVIDTRGRRRRFARLTAAGREAVRAGLEVRRDFNELTTELLVSGRWRDVEFRPYDITLPGRRPAAGKRHPFGRILDETRRVFLDMGFEETASPWVESAFWDFDALFQPQDHPARDMQDTFYVAQPARCALPDPETVERVRRTHEDGGETGSLGWRYRWDARMAERCVLRTHTTAATIRSLAADPRPPRKVFCIGPVFRRETIDYKHLPVFHQVDGIVIDEQASFSALLTLLLTFYRKIGFERVQFRPAFFPYTEPSVEAFVWMDSRQDWV
ncbi:MAG: phenylalanine--tRNA ligase subunit alpha, partial [Acidobacteriota bacterium]